MKSSLQKSVCVAAVKSKHPIDKDDSGESNSFGNFDFNSFMDLARSSKRMLTFDPKMLKMYTEHLTISNIDHFRHVCVFIYRIYNLSGFGDLVISSIDFLSNMFGTEKLLEAGKSIYHVLNEMLTTFYNSLLMSPPTTEGRAVDALRFIKSRLSTVYNSNIVTALRDFVLSLVTFGCFKRKTNDRIIRALGPAPRASGVEMVESILESCISFLTFGEQVTSGAPLSDIFSHKDPVATFNNRAHELETLKDLTYSGLPVDGKVCRRDFLFEVSSCIASGEALVKSLPFNAPQRRPVDISLKKMKIIKASFLTMMNAEERPMPYCVCVTGLPGIGKGLLVDYFGMVWSDVKGRTYDKSHVYHRQATEDYWSGYEPASKPIIHYSEPGSLHVQIAKTRGDPTMTEFLSVCDNQPYMCNMADVESKGKVYALPELIVMDCNDKKMNLNQIVNNPSAIRRRILYVEPVVKPEFAKADGKRIDQAKSLNSTTPKLDRWTFTVYHEVPVDLKESRTEYVLRNASIYELTSFLHNEYDTHIAEQENRCNILKDVNIKDYITEGNVIHDFLTKKQFSEFPLIDDYESKKALTRLREWRFTKPREVFCDWVTTIVWGLSGNGTVGHILFFYAWLVLMTFSPLPFIYLHPDAMFFLTSTVSGPFLEELFKEYIPSGCHLFGVLEYGLYVTNTLMSGDFSIFLLILRIYPMLSHGWMFDLSFKERMKLHSGYNGLVILLEWYVVPWIGGYSWILPFTLPPVLQTLYYVKDEGFECFKQPLFAGLTLFLSLLNVIGMSFLSFSLPYVPATVYKWIAIHLFKGKVEQSRSYLFRDYHYFKATLGLSNEFNGDVVPRIEISSLISVMSAVLFLWRAGSFAHGLFLSEPFTEGNILSTSKEWEEEEVEEAIEQIEKDCRCERPPPRKRKGNGIDWESFERPVPEPINQVQRNERPKIVSTVMKNVRAARFYGTTTTESYVFGICEDIALVNRHTLAHPKKGCWHVEIRLEFDNETSLRKCTVDNDEIYKVDGDVWLIRLRGLKFKDIREYISADYITPEVYGNVGEIGGEKVLVKPSQRIVAKDENWGIVPIERPLVYKWTKHKNGQCATPLFMEYGGGFGVVGIHIAGTYQTESFSQAIRLPSITQAMKFLSHHSCSLGVNSEGRIRLPPKTKIGKGVNERSPICYEDVKGIDVYGTLEGHLVGRPGKSKLQESPFMPYVEKLIGVSPKDENSVPLFGPPHFSHGFNKETGEYQAPFNHFIKQCGIVKNSLNPKILAKAIQVVSRHVIDRLEARGVTELRPVPLAVAVNGDPEDFYTRPVKPSTSGGFPYPGKKSKHMRDCCLPFKEDAKEFTQDINEQVLEQLMAYERGEDALPLLGAQLKDEARSHAKNKDRKTRVFCMSPVESTLVNKMFLSPFYTIMVEFCEEFCAAIGINMQSTDVTDLVNRMTMFSDKFMEGDYKGYDTSMPYDIGLAGNSVVYNVLKHFGYNDRELTFVKGILSDNLYPILVMRGVIFAAPGLQASGKYATAEDNSLRGLLLLVYAFIEECTDFGALHSERSRTQKFKPEDFFSLVLPVIYGDDMVAAVKSELQKYFNNVTYQKFCREVYGLDFTNAQKTMEMSEFLTWDKTSFLKRSFIFREDIGQWVAPIEKTSIMKSLCYFLPSRCVNTRDQLIDICVSAAREMFFHLHSDEYDQCRWNFAEVIAEVYELQSTDVIQKFPTFEEIRTQCYGERHQLL